MASRLNAAAAFAALLCQLDPGNGIPANAMGIYRVLGVVTRCYMSCLTEITLDSAEGWGTPNT